MTSPQLDILAIGDAIVDVIAPCEDAFLDAHGLTKGAMQLLDAPASDRLYAAMGQAQAISGGSAANSLAGIAALGLDAAFVGQVADDQLGEIFAHGMRSLGVRFDTAPLAGGLPTGRCLILVTPDAQRTMNTCPGASHELTPTAIDDDLVRSAKITFLEGYLWGPEQPRLAMIKAATIARSSSRTIAFTLSESLCIGDRRKGVMGMIDDGLVDILFGNEHEVRHLTGCASLNDCLESLSGKVETLIVTRGAAGAVARQNGEQVTVSAAPIERIVDTTGAGDQFAAGVLAARCRGKGLRESLELGAVAAAEVISHYGARPLADLKQMVAL
ncbi:MAG TPA: adenosine kinase [Sphingomicrobium sp.]|nr:adenosine kinase [Sphingomicrobium sp.]